jgi:hypothetical protein
MIAALCGHANTAEDEQVDSMRHHSNAAASNQGSARPKKEG